MSKTYLGYGYTNENGVATLDYDPNGEELPRRSYQCRSRTATVVAETTVEGVVHSSAKMKFCEGYVPPKPVPTLSITGSDIDVGDILGLSGTLSAGSGKSVKVYQGNTLIDTVTTGSEGAYSTSVSELGAGTYTFRAEFEGDAEYSSVVSSTLEITVSKLTPTISLTGSDISVGETLALSGVLSAGTGYSVKVYQGSSLVDTVTTGTGGAFTSSISNLDAGSYGFYALFEGDGVYEEVVSSNVQITVSKLSTTLSLEGENVQYGETLALSGVLSAGSGESVKIYEHGSLFDTITTGIGGAFSKNINNLNAGTYIFKAEFEGNGAYEEAVSSNLPIIISKLASTITLSGSNITVGETLNLTGVLSVGSGRSVKVYQGESVIDTVTTGANGAFSKSVTGLSAGTYSFKAVFDGETNYQGSTSSILSITVSEVQQSLAVSVDESVLSYYDSDSATITATLLRGSAPISGETVTFKNGSTVLDTVTTDSSGVAEYTYTSQGVGDVTITAECNALSDDVDIEDCLYAPQLDGTETIHQIQGTTTISNGEMYGGSGYIGAFDNTGNWELTFKGKLGNNSCAVLLIKSDETIRDNNEIISPWKSVWKYVNGQSTSYDFTNGLEYNTYYSYKITKNGNNITFEVNGNTVSFNWSLATTLSTLSIGVDSWGQGISYIKDVKVKPLHSLSVSSNKSVLSYYDTDSATITATLLNGSTPISGETVTFKNGSTVLGTDVTDANGVAEYTYSSQGVGDVTITAEYGQLSDDVTIEDVPFARMTEYSCTKTSGTVKQQFFDNSVSFDLPNDFELELEFWSDGSPTWNNQEQRLFIMPKSLYVEGSQPSTAFFIGDTRCGEWEFGVRRDGSTSSIKPSGFVCEQYQKVKFKRQTDNKIYLYLNDATTPYDHYQLTDAFNYHDWTICFHLWYNGTVKIRNIKLTEL